MNWLMNMNFTRTLSILLAAGSGFAVHCASAATKVDFAKDIAPIFEKSCVECHGAEKQKGKLRLDTKEATFKGGENGDAVVAGKPDKSDVYRRVVLAKGHDDIMPPKGDPLSKAQQDLIKAWIEQGADWPAGLALKSGAPGEGPKAAVDPAKIAGPKPTPAELKAVAELAKYGVNARELANGVNWRYANFRTAGSKFDPKAFALLKDIANLQELNLSAVELKDADLANIAGLKNLAVLNLSGSTVTDAGLAHLKNLGDLASLNLFNTKITDAAVKHLAALKSLKTIYIFETKITDAGAAELAKALPKTRIDRGWDLKELAKIDAAAKEAQAKAEAAKAAEKKADPKKAADPAAKTDKAKKKKK